MPTFGGIQTIGPIAQTGSLKITWNAAVPDGGESFVAYNVYRAKVFNEEILNGLVSNDILAHKIASISNIATLEYIDEKVSPACTAVYIVRAEDTGSEETNTNTLAQSPISTQAVQATVSFTIGDLAIANVNISKSVDRGTQVSLNNIPNDGKIYCENHINQAVDVYLYQNVQNRENKYEGYLMKRLTRNISKSQYAYSYALFDFWAALEQAVFYYDPRKYDGMEKASLISEIIGQSVVGRAALASDGISGTYPEQFVAPGEIEQKAYSSMDLVKTLLGTMQDATDPNNVKRYHLMLMPNFAGPVLFLLKDVDISAGNVIKTLSDAYAISVGNLVEDERSFTTRVIGVDTRDPTQYTDLEYYIPGAVLNRKMSLIEAEVDTAELLEQTIQAFTDEPESTREFTITVPMNYDLMPGDIISLETSIMGLTGIYRVQDVNIRASASEISTSVTVSNRKTRLTDVIATK